MRVSVPAEELVTLLVSRFPALQATLSVPSPNVDVRLTMATHDSRMVEAGSLFCCVRGGAFDGHRFAAEAVANGATALLVDHVLPAVNVHQIVVRDTRKSMGPVSAALLGFPSEKLTMIGVTGTNGKTTTSHLLADIFRSQGINCHVIGTLTQKRTTPEATDLQEQLADLVAAGATCVVMEVTSHALELHRVAAIRYGAAVFTNLSQDHLDFHGTMEAYFRAKAKLFEPEYADRAIANVDDTYGRLLHAMQQVPTEAFSINDAEELNVTATGSTFRWRGQSFELPMAGAFNVMNALAAASTAASFGVDLTLIADALAHASVPGRYEAVAVGQDFSVVVDFAHTPDGLERVLRTAKTTLRAGGRLISVFGCGGDRDRGKRPLMGAIAANLSDIAVVTSDNPRTEDPDLIISEILAGIEDPTHVVVQPDRREAIRAAFQNAIAGDVVVIAGKGHESGQTVGTETVPFDDRVVAAEILIELGLGGTPR
jgi:UDP-N-acetylmuramoyl-L-alanyl-D-glutamate--2,6-diaminopimelate ligase